MLSSVVAVTEQVRGWRGERRVLARVTRAAWRLERAEVERVWALASAEGVWIRTLAGTVGLSSTRVHQLVTVADPGALWAELGQLGPPVVSSEKQRSAVSGQVKGYLARSRGLGLAWLQSRAGKWWGGRGGHAGRVLRAGAGSAVRIPGDHPGGADQVLHADRCRGRVPGQVPRLPQCAGGERATVRVAVAGVRTRRGQHRSGGGGGRDRPKPWEINCSTCARW